MPTSVTPQSKVGGVRSPRSLLEAIAGVAQDYIVHPPNIITVNGTALPRGKGDKIRIIQNLGTVAVYYLIDDIEDAGPGVGQFHGVLMGGASQDDGAGGTIDFSNIATRISVYAASGLRVSAIRMSGPESGM